MKNNSGFTLLELLCGLFICSLILVLLVPNLILEFNKLKEVENKLTLKVIIYEELTKNEGKEFSIERDGYFIELNDNKINAKDLTSGEIIFYE